MNNPNPPTHAQGDRQKRDSRSIFRWYHRTPLYVRIMIALAIGLVVGKVMGPGAAKFKPFSDVVLQLLTLLATPLIFVAVVQALLKAQATGRTAARLAYLLMTNTIVAIIVGLLVANVIRPGRWAPLGSGERIEEKPFNFLRNCSPTSPMIS